MLDIFPFLKTLEETTIWVISLKYICYASMVTPTFKSKQKIWLQFLEKHIIFKLSLILLSLFKFYIFLIFSI